MFEGDSGECTCELTEEEFFWVTTGELAHEVAIITVATKARFLEMDSKLGRRGFLGLPKAELTTVDCRFT